MNLEYAIKILERAIKEDDCMLENHKSYKYPWPPGIKRAEERIWELERAIKKLKENN